MWQNLSDLLCSLRALKVKVANFVTFLFLFFFFPSFFLSFFYCSCGASCASVGNTAVKALEWSQWSKKHLFVMQIGDQSGTDPTQAVVIEPKVEAFLSGFPSAPSQYLASCATCAADCVNCWVSSPAAASLWINSWVCSADDWCTTGQLVVYSKQRVMPQNERDVVMMTECKNNCSCDSRFGQVLLAANYWTW